MQVAGELIGNGLVGCAASPLAHQPITRKTFPAIAIFGQYCRGFGTICRRCQAAGPHFRLGTGGALMWVSEPDGEDKGKFERRKKK
jgi:hypothetical protein